MLSVKAVIFDLDGTLHDRNGTQTEFIRQLSQRFPHLFKDKDIGTVISAFLESDRLADADFEAGSPWTQVERSRCFLSLLGINEDYADLISDVYVRECPIIHLPISGAVPTVKELSKRFQTAVITNGFSDV